MTAPKPLLADPLADVPPALRSLFERALPDADAIALVAPNDSTQAIVDRWTAESHGTSALRVLAHLLPAREGAWWAWVAARHVTTLPGAPVATPQVQSALAAVEQWIVRPDDNARRSTWEAGQLAGVDTPVGLVTAAIFLSGGSVAPPDVAHVPPPPGVSATLIASAVILAACSVPEHVDSMMQAFVAQGAEIVKRLGGWDQAVAGAQQRIEAEQRQYVQAKGTQR